MSTVLNYFDTVRHILCHAMKHRKSLIYKELYESVSKLRNYETMIQYFETMHLVIRLHLADSGIFFIAACCRNRKN